MSHFRSLFALFCLTLGIILGIALMLVYFGEEQVVTYDAAITVRLEAVGRSIDDSTAPEDSKMWFDVYVDRTDLGWVEPDNPDGSLSPFDLPESQQIERIGVEWDSAGVSVVCHPFTLPHRCEVPYGGPYVLSVTFADGGIATTLVEVPEAPLPDRPEITSPSELPEQGDLFSMTFKDIGATTYKASVELCHPYQNDGSDPCLLGSNFFLFKEEETLEWVLEWPVEGTTIEINSEAGTIRLSSDLPLVFEESVRYRVCGGATGAREDGIKTYWGSCDLVEFER